MEQAKQGADHPQQTEQSRRLEAQKIAQINEMK